MQLDAQIQGKSTVTSYSSISIPQPKNWQDFERNARVLFECILEDVNVQNNGRSGQRQHGVDIFGQKKGQGPWYGIQCKGKDGGYGKQVTEKELRREVEKTRKFEPPISYFILITTAPVDGAIQAIARTITEERAQGERPLNVAVWGWGELESKISQYPQALQAFHPDITPFTEQISRDTDRLISIGTENSETLRLILQAVHSQNRSATTDDRTSAALEAFDKSLHAEIDGYRDLIKAGRPLTALRLLVGVKERVWDSASERIKFRLITNIASCKLQLGNEKEAIDHFLEAIAYQPNDKIGLANVALAYLLNSEHQQSIEASQAALGQDEENADAASYLIQAHIEDASITNPLELVPEAVRLSEAVDIACLHFFRTRHNFRWVEHARRAIDRHPNSEQIRRYTAEAELECAFTTQGWRLGQKPREPIDVAALAHSAAILQELWNKQYGSESPSRDPSIAANLIQVYKALEKDDSARTVAEQAIERMPNDPNLIKLRAGFYREENQIDDALRLLQNSNNDPECLLMAAEILAGTSPVAALEKLRDFEQIETATHFYRMTAICLRVGAWLAHPEFSPAERVKAAEIEHLLLQELFPDSPLTSIVRAQILQASDEDPTVVKQVLINAKAVLTDETPFYERFLLAKKLESIESNVDVTDLLDGRVDASHDSPALRTLLIALLNTDQRLKAYKLLSEIPAKIAEQPLYLRVAISLHLRRGDYRAAEDAANKLIELNPADLQTHLTRVDIWLRRRDESAVKDFLETTVELLDGEPKQIMRLAHLLARFGFEDRALKLGYKTHLKNRKNPDLQLSYIGLLLNPGSPRSINLDKTAVEIDAAFSIKNGLGETETFVIESDENLNLTDETIPPNHTFATAANGLAVGQPFTIKGVEWEITSVKHKYLHLLHNKLEHFDRHFPENSAIQLINMKQEDGSTDLEPFFQKLREQNEYIERALDMYQNSRIPLEFFADYLGRDVIDAWYGLAQLGRDFKVCHGNQMERIAAMKDVIANNKVGCVVDALTLHIVRVLGIEKAVVKVCGPLAATESTIDTFRLRYERMLSQGAQPYMTLFWKDGQVYREEITAEQLEARRAAMAAELDWIDRNVEVLPAETEQPISSEAASTRDAISYSFLDPLLAAQGSNRLLLCEDQSYRQFGVKEFGIRASWLQPMLMLARDRREITPREYCEAVYRLGLARHNFTSIDAYLLYYGAREEHIQFGTLAEQLFGVDADLESHMQVMVSFLDATWGRRQPNIREQSATSGLLRRLCFGEWARRIPNADAYQLLSVLANAFSHPAFVKYLRNWSVGHVTTQVGYKTQNEVANT